MDQLEKKETSEILSGVSEIQRLHETVKFYFKAKAYPAEIFYWPGNHNAPWDCDVYERERNGSWRYVYLSDKSEKTKEKMLLTTFSLLEDGVG